MLATLAFSGLRLSELLALRWRDVDLAGGWLHVHVTKTDSGERRVKIRGALRDELVNVRAQVEAVPDGYVFPTATGNPMGQDNFRNRVVAGAVKRADVNLAAAEMAPLPRITPQSLRRTFSSVLYALGESPPVVMAEMGHTDPALALRAYAQAMRMDDSERDNLRALVEGEFRHGKGTNEPSTRPELTVEMAA
jgi:integrase